MGWSPRSALVIVAACGFVIACDSPAAEKTSDTPPSTAPLKSKKVSEQERLDALSRATVWQRPTTPITKARLDSDPNQPKSIECTFAVTEVGGTAPKFDCHLETGERIRVKYGRSPEIPSEVAAARLLHALVFGAVNVILVEKLCCLGCPDETLITVRPLGFHVANDL